MDAVVCMVAPNGARRNKVDHQAIPLTISELAGTAKAAAEAGATAMHLHVRDSFGNHSLSVDLYRRALDEVLAVCGDQLLLQITTESAGVYNVEQQINLVYELQPLAVSLSVRELARAKEIEISQLDRWMRDQQMLPQWIIYDLDDFEIYKRWIKNNTLCGSDYPLLFVLGNYAGKMDGSVEMLTPFLNVLDGIRHWMVCAFGCQEQNIMKSVITQGGHMRVGFENNLWQPNKVLVRNNAELVSSSIRSAHELGFEIASKAQTRDFFTPAW